MERRYFLKTALAVSIAFAARVQARASRARRTRWKVRTSQGFDAIAFLGPLSGGELYTEYYAQEAAEFGSRLSGEMRAEIVRLWKAATTDGFGLLGPNLALLLSTDGNDATIDTVLRAIRNRQEHVRPKYRSSSYWNENDWKWFDGAAPRLERVFAAMREAGFAQYWVERAGSDLPMRAGEVERGLSGFDVVTWQEKLTGRVFDPTIEIVLLQFSKPHGIKVQGQTFLQSVDYDTATTVRIAAHEMLHPPVPMDGTAAKAALDVLASDSLIPRIVREHDPRWGYTTLEGMFNEDLCQALDQLISEALGVARNPADRWRKSDDGMHVLAAGFYGLLRQDRWTDTGGNIEAWLAEATRRGRLASSVLHPVAARVLERPVDRLWPLRAG